MGGMFPHSFWTAKYWPGTYWPPMVDELVFVPPASSSRHYPGRNLYPPIHLIRENDEAIALSLLLV